jgi:pyruvate/2-oxoglutarate dehydrogenase complex dihydrolipoamide dehydrogenase (E3) component
VAPTRYRIILRGRLTERLGSAFDGMALEPGNGRTVLVGDIRDQSHLFGVLDRVRNLGLELVSVEPSDDEPSEGRAAKPDRGHREKEMAEQFDVIVLGGGPAGEHAVGRCTDAGLSTALVEHELVGGECSYWACMPSKTLLRPGQVLAAARRVPGAAQAVTGDLDADAALARRDWMTAGWDDKGQATWLDGVGATLIRGRGRLAGVRTVEVETSDGSSRRITARRAVILATGSTPFIPPIEGLRDIRTWDNRDVTSAKQVPARLLILGGGPVGAEMAQAWRRLGSAEVTVVEAAERLLSHEEPFAGEQVARALTEEGITVIVGTKMVAARRDADDAPVVGTLEDGRTITADEILVAVGRRPNTANVGLETVGLEPGRPMPVDDTLCAIGVPGGWLYGIGDVNGRALFTHMGKYHARIAVDALLGRPVTDKADHDVVPRVTFTDPQVASVGLTEAQARDRGLSVRAVRIPLQETAAAAVAGEDVTGTAQLVIDEARQVVVGATFTGPDIDGILHSATVAIVGEVPMDRLRHAVAAFPTLSEMWLELDLAYRAERASSDPYAKGASS